MIYTRFDFATSFTEEAEPEVSQALSLLTDYSYYYYKENLVKQWGLSIEGLASEIYSNLPTVVWHNESWTVSQATLLEKRMIERGDSKVLVLLQYANCSIGDLSGRRIKAVPLDSFNPIYVAELIEGWLKEIAI